MARHPNPEAAIGSRGYNIRWRYCSLVSAREGSTAVVAADQQNYVAGASTIAEGGAQANSA
jgi:hypothetical protein